MHKINHSLGLSFAGAQGVLRGSAALALLFAVSCSAESGTPGAPVAAELTAETRERLALKRVDGTSDGGFDDFSGAREPNTIDLFPAIRYVGRHRGDRLGRMTTGEVIVETSQWAQRGTPRWGDYSAMTVDPVDGCTFWYTNQYIDSPAPSAFGFGHWGTRLVSFRFPGCRDPWSRGDDTFDEREPLPGVNVPGLDYTGEIPPDPNGAVGRDYFVQAVNAPGGAVFAVFDKKTGAELDGPAPFHSAGPVSANCQDGFGDPIVLWDPIAERWVLSEASDAGTLCVLVSTGPDPRSRPWYTYEFQTPEFADFEKVAVYATEDGTSAYIATTNESSPAAYAFERDKMLRGAPARFQRFAATPLAGLTFQSLTPVDVDGERPFPAGSPALFMRQNDDELNSPATADPNADFLEVYSLAVNFADPSQSRFSGPQEIPVADFNSVICATEGSCVRQPGAATRLDPISEVIMWRLPYRNFGTYGSIVGNFVTNVETSGVAGIRWFELRSRRKDAWTLYQEGTLSPDTANRWLGSIAMDRDGDIAMGYSASSSDSPLRDPYEPNNDPARATPVLCGFVSDGAAIDPVGDVDYYRLGAPAGSTVAAETIAQKDSSRLDTVLVIYDSSGKQVAFNDDGTPPGEPLTQDSYVQFQMPADGIVVVLARSFNAGSLSASGPYTLSLQCKQ